MHTRKPDANQLISTMPDNGKAMAGEWFQTLRDQICSEFEAIERQYADQQGGGAGTFVRKKWDRPEGGGGEMSLMRGQVFEKVGVNISTVHSKFSEQFVKEMPGGGEYPYFWASGISLVAHMQSPLLPAVHMNTRMIVLSSKASPIPNFQSQTPTLQWFGGGADLTPMVENPENTTDFHAAFKAACDQHDPDYYAHYKAWCDEYFYLPHRKEPRGVGGIFYDYLNTGNWQHGFDFTRDVGKAFLSIYPQLVRRHMYEPWTKAQRQHQLEKRGRYVEFNLLHDRGTRFGLMTGGNTEAILMSMPPEVTWR